MGAAALAVLGVVLVPADAAAATGPQDGHVYALTAAHSGKNAQVDSGSQADAASVVQKTASELTRGILRELDAVDYPGTVRILTKSPVVARDNDLLTSLPWAEAGMTVTTTDDKVGRRLEVGAPPAARRQRTLAGVPVFAFLGPLPPHFATRPELLDHLSGGLIEVGVREVYMEHINLKRCIRERMDEVLAGEREEVREAYVQAQGPPRAPGRDRGTAARQARAAAALRRGRLPRRFHRTRPDVYGPPAKPSAWARTPPHSSRPRRPPEKRARGGRLHESVPSHAETSVRSRRLPTAWQQPGPRESAGRDPSSESEAMFLTSSRPRHAGVE